MAYTTRLDIIIILIVHIIVKDILSYVAAHSSKMKDFSYTYDWEWDTHM